MSELPENEDFSNSFLNEVSFSAFCRIMLLVLELHFSAVYKTMQ